MKIPKVRETQKLRKYRAFGDEFYPLADSARRPPGKEFNPLKTATYSSAACESLSSLALRGSGWRLCLREKELGTGTAKVPWVSEA